jgi:hypothetical protein
MGKSKPKLVWHKFPGSVFLFLLRKCQSPLLPPSRSPFLLAEKTIGDTKSHFELTLAISKENSPKCKIYAYRRAFRGKTECLSVPDEGSHTFYGDGGVLQISIFILRSYLFAQELSALRPRSYRAFSPPKLPLRSDDCSTHVRFRFRR